MINSATLYAKNAKKTNSIKTNLGGILYAAAVKWRHFDVFIFYFEH